MDDELEKIQEQLDELAKRFGLTNKQLAGLAMVAGKSSNDFKKSVNSLVNDVNKTDQSYRDMLRTVKDMDDALSKLTDSEEDNLRKNEILEERSRVLRQATTARLDRDMEQFGEVLVNKTTSAVGDFTKGLQSGASANSLATGILRGGVDIAASGFKTIATGTQAFGTALSNAKNPLVAFTGGLIAGVGAVGSAAAEAARQLTQFAVTILSTEVDRTVTAFQKVTQVGAGFTEGMTGMRNAAGNAYVTLEEFSNVLVRQADNIAKAGLGFEGALQRASGVQNIFAQNNSQVRDQLLRLGFGFEEQGDLIFETMSDMRRGGLLQRSSDSEIAEQTQKYAENLRAIAGITGEDARKRMDDARGQMQNMAVQQKILEMQKSNPAAYQKLQGQLAAMPKEMQKGYLEFVTMGSVIDKTTNVAMAQIPAIRGAYQAQLAVLNDSTADQKMAVDETMRQRGLVSKNMEETIGVTGQIGRAALAGVGGVVGDVANFQAGLYNSVAGQTDETGKRVRSGLDNQMTSTDQLTTELMGAAHAAQDMKIIIQDELLGVLGDYAEVTKKALELFRSMISEITGRSPQTAEETKLDTDKQSLRQMQDNAGQNWLGRLTGVGDTDEIESLKKEIANQKVEMGRKSLANDILKRNQQSALAQIQRSANSEKYGDVAKIFSNDVPLSEEQRKAAELTGYERFIAGEKLGGTGRADLSNYVEKPYAMGGVAKGPVSGYSATLHGTEAVVPLPNGESIPVTMKTPTSSGEAQTQMIDVLQNQLSELRQQTALTYDMLKSMDKGNRTQNKILTAGY